MVHATMFLASLAPEVRATQHQEKCRNAADSKACGNRWRGIGVEFQQANLRFKLACGSLEHRGHRAAGAAPRRPNVDKKRNIAVRYVAGKSRFIDLNGAAAEDRLVARSAVRGRHRPIGGQPVDLPAFSTDDLSSCAHVPVLSSSVLTSLIFLILSWSSRKRS